MASDPNAGVCLIRRVVIRNYKSIAACDVELGPLTFLVGPNGSGKSNFLDALHFIAEALRFSLDHALRNRVGSETVRRGSGANRKFAIRVDFQLPSGAHGHYAIEIVVPVGGSFWVAHEECFLSDIRGHDNDSHYYRVSAGEVTQSTLAVEPAAVRDRLFLVNLSGNPVFRPVYDALSGMGFYNLNPDVIRDVQSPGPRQLLARDGANLASVLEALSSNNPRRKARIEEYLAQVVPGVLGIEVRSIGPRETVVFRQQPVQSRSRRPFPASSMSDGTLRTLGILIALFQSGPDSDPGPLLVGVEEPETALHPAAAAVLIDAIRDALLMRQVIVTSHSPDLLDNASITDSEILAVLAEDGMTRIARLEEASRSVLREHLFTAGDLLRMNQLRPDSAADALKPEDVVLFGTGAPA
jgi:predicted ATPase